MAFTEDLSPFFNTDDFAVTATYTHASVGRTVNVIFDAVFADPLGIESNHPRAYGIESDFPDVAQDDTLSISGTTYKIKGVHTDGTGIVAFRLQEQ